MSPEPRQTKPAHARALDSRALALGTVALLALGGLTAPACADDAGGEFNGGPTGAAVRLGFHLEAARKIEQARESRMLREAIEDFDDYVI